MKFFLTLCFFFSAYAVLGQPDSARVARERIKDSMVTAIQQRVGIQRAKADSVYTIIMECGQKIRSVVRSRLPKEEKDRQTSGLAVERDDKINRLLSEEQIVKLKAVFSRGNGQH